MASVLVECSIGSNLQIGKIAVRGNEREVLVHTTTGDSPNPSLFMTATVTHTCLDFTRTTRDL